MPYEMIWEDRGLYRRHYGHTTDSEIAEGTQITEASPLFDELRYVILDFLGVTTLDISSPSFIEELAAINSAAAMTNPNIKVAVVTTDSGIIRLAKMYASHELTPYTTCLFSNIDDARAWVAVNSPPKNRSHKMTA